MEFKEAYKKGLKLGQTITNGSYKLKLKPLNKNNFKDFIITATNLTNNEEIYFDLTGLFFHSLEDNWEIIREE